MTHDEVMEILTDYAMHEIGVIRDLLAAGLPVNSGAAIINTARSAMLFGMTCALADPSWALDILTTIDSMITESGITHSDLINRTLGPIDGDVGDMRREAARQFIEAHRCDD